MYILLLEGKVLIPKIVHYCWFGGNEKPTQVQMYIQSWKDKLPGYEFVEWNENNFPIDYCQYTIDAYNNKKYAFVSDVARLYALHNYGGVYFDTDVEVRKSLDDYLDADIVVSFESSSLLMTGFFASSINNEVIKGLLDEYQNRCFIQADGSLNTVANTVYLTEYLKRNCGLQVNCKEQTLEHNIKVYTYKLFGAFFADMSSFFIDENTILVHHCMASWQNRRFKVLFYLKKWMAKHMNRLYVFLIQTKTFLRK